MPDLSIPRDAKLDQSHLVNFGDTIARIDPRLPAVLGTFTLVEWMETIAAKLVQQYLPEGYLTVGAKVEIEHLAATPQGAEVTITAKVEQVDGGTVSFTIEAHDALEKVAVARHVRTVMPVQFVERRVTKKAEKLGLHGQERSA